MAFSFVEYPGDGQTLTYSVPFPYIEKSHVKAALDGVEVPFQWNSDNVIQVNAAFPSSSILKIYRQTPKSQRLVDFADDSIMDEALLDLMSMQLFYIAQEAYDLSATSIVVVEDGNYDARDRRVKNVDDPIDPSDAVNLRTFQSDFLPRLQAEADRAALAAGQAVALKASYDSLYQDLQVRSQQFNSAYNQINTWQQSVSTKHDRVVQAEVNVTNLAAQVQLDRNAISSDKAEALAEINSVFASVSAQLSSASTEVAAQVQQVEVLAAYAQDARLAAEQNATQAAQSATTAGQARDLAIQARDVTLQYKQAVEALGTDAVALQEAVASAEAAAARAEAAEGASVTWDLVADKPATFPPSAHTHPWSEVTDKPTEYPAAYHQHGWADITGKPTAYPPTTHGHDWTEIANKPAFFNGSYTSLTNVPTTFAPSAHTHPWDQVTGKPTVYPSDWASISNIPTTFTPSAHTHTIAQVTGLQTALDGKAAASHTHSTAQITGLGTAATRNITISTAQPSGGADGDIWFVVT